MDKIKQLIESQKEEFDNFISVYPDRDPDFAINVHPYHVENWHTNSLHALLDAVIEMEEKGIIEYTMKDDYRVGYNLAKTDTIATLQTIKKLL